MEIAVVWRDEGDSGTGWSRTDLLIEPGPNQTHAALGGSVFPVRESFSLPVETDLKL